MSGESGGRTGWLVANDLVLTNWHVVRRVLAGEKQPGDVICRFDYATSSTGTNAASLRPRGEVVRGLQRGEQHRTGHGPGRADEAAAGLRAAAAGEADGHDEWRECGGRPARIHRHEARHRVAGGQRRRLRAAASAGRSAEDGDWRRQRHQRQHDARDARREHRKRIVGIAVLSTRSSNWWRCTTPEICCTTA